MSEQSTMKTQELLLEQLPQVFSGSSTERWAAQQELVAKAEELAGADLVDDGAIREITTANAEKYELDHDAADGVFDIVKKPAGGSLAAMHAPSFSVWRGTGSSLTVAGSEPVHYINRPGIVEEWYGPALPYIVDKLAWLAIAHDLKGHFWINNEGGYQYVTNRLHHLGRSGMPHIGPAYMLKEWIGNWVTVPDAAPEKLLTSASGTLVTPAVDHFYEVTDPNYQARAIVDEAAGLFDGHIENRRAGLYDVAFSLMVGRVLYGQEQNHQMLKVLDSKYYEGVDIN